MAKTTSFFPALRDTDMKNSGNDPLQEEAKRRTIPWKLLLRIAVSAAVLGYFAVRIDLTDLAEVFVGLDTGVYAVSVAVAICGSIVISLKYFLLARGTDVETPFARVVAINFVARFYGLLVPSGAGQAAVRWYKMTRGAGGKLYFAAASVLERLLFLATALLLVVAPLYLVDQSAPIRELRAAISPLLGAAGVGLALGFAYFFLPALRRAMVSVSGNVPLLRGERFQNALKRLSVDGLHRSRVVMLIGLSVLWQLIYIARVYALFAALGTQMPFLQVAWISSLVFLLQVLPISIAGLGVREGAYVYILSLYGFPANLGFALGLLFFTHMLVFAAIGGILNLTEGLTQTQG